MVLLNSAMMCVTGYDVFLGAEHDANVNLHAPVTRLGLPCPRNPQL
jgi:hypothetical protein